MPAASVMLILTGDQWQNACRAKAQNNIKAILTLEGVDSAQGPKGPEGVSKALPYTVDYSEILMLCEFQ